MKIRKPFLIREVFFCCLICLSVLSFALGDTTVEITGSEEEWSWEAGHVDSFHGKIVPDKDYADAELQLSVETRLENSGEVLFTVDNGKKLKIRKRAPELTVNLTAGEEYTFEGEWLLPEEMEEEIARAAITLRVLESGGAEIAASVLEAGSAAEDSAQMNDSPVHRVNQLLLILGIACAVVWAAAVIRHLALNRRRARTA